MQKEVYIMKSTEYVEREADPLIQIFRICQHHKVNTTSYS